MPATAKTKQAASTDPVAEFLAQHPTGSRFGGGFVVDRAPFIPNGILIIAPKATEITASWKKAAAHSIDIADAPDFRLLDRFEMLLCFKRLAQRLTIVPEFKAGGGEEFERDTYWTNEEYEFDSGFAWIQAFGLGGSVGWGKSFDLRVRLGRIVLI